MHFDEVEIDPLWRLHDEFTVEQAAALIAGYDPGYIAQCRNDTNFESNYSRLYPARTALINAINAKRLKATIRRNAHLQGWDEDPSDDEGLRPLDPEDDDSRRSYKPRVIYCKSPDWGKTTVALNDVRAWLATRGLKTGFFFPTATDAPTTLTPAIRAMPPSWRRRFERGKP